MYAVSVLCLVSLIWAPDFDYCASQGKHYFGYKLHVLCGLSGVIHSYDPPKASVYDINYMKDIKPLYRDCCIFGDKGYSVRKSNLTFSAAPALNKLLARRLTPCQVVRSPMPTKTAPLPTGMM